MPVDYLHNPPQFADLIRIVSAENGIDPALVEKDYWIMHCLYGLQQLGLKFELKGGTSLSKGHGIIHRFSFMRHHYDVYSLLKRPEVQEFIGTDAYKGHKAKRFRGGDERDLTKNQAF